MVSFLKVAYANQIVYQVVVLFTKLGLCMFYRRVFQDDKSRTYINWNVGFLFVSGILALALVIFPCMPIRDFWSVEGKCPPNYSNIYISAACSIIADVILVAFAIARVRTYS